MNLRNFLLLLFLLSVVSCKRNGSNPGTQEKELERETPQQEVVAVVSDTIRVNRPEENSIISSPLTIEGEGRGYWFFEGTAPVEIIDEENAILGRGSIEVEEEWMTEDFVPFSGKIDFDPSGAEKGFLVLHRSNPSGLPENSHSVRIPVEFRQ